MSRASGGDAGGFVSGLSNVWRWQARLEQRGVGDVRRALIRRSRFGDAAGQEQERKHGDPLLCGEEFGIERPLLTWRWFFYLYRRVSLR
jgi:hypothetical protein